MVSGSNRAASLIGIAICVGWAISASAQVVQLPTFRTFSYSGSVLVPDRGTASLGGNRTAASSWQRRGANRAWGRQAGFAGASASATVIDLQAIDRRLLGQSGLEAATRRAAAGGTPGALDSEPGKALVRSARRSLAAGRDAAAFQAYREAIVALRGRLRQLAEEEFRRHFGAAAEQAIRLASARD